MKGDSLARRFAVPLVSLLLIPALACGIFFLTARAAARHQTEEELQKVQDAVSDYLTETFSGENEHALRDFLGYANHFVPTDTPAGLIVFDKDFRMLHPHTADEDETVRSLAGEFAEALQKNSLHSGNYFTDRKGGRYLVNINTPPSNSKTLGYTIVYCPESKIGEWVWMAALLAMSITAIPTALSFIVLLRTVKKVNEPLRQLCEKAVQIGERHYEPIEPGFPLRETEELRQAMNSMARQLDTSQKNQQILVENISHELRTPLMSIAGYAQGVREGVFTDLDSAMDIIMADSSRMADMISDLLTLTRLEAPRVSYSMYAFSIQAVADNCMDLARMLAAQSGKTAVLHGPDREILAEGNEELLKTALENLLVNAIRYAKERVSLCLGTKNDRVEICVCDDGPGVDPETLPHLFDRFYTGTDGRFGLGLPIAKSAAELMGGSITASNSPEGGAVFTITLKKADEI